MLTEYSENFEGIFNHATNYMSRAIEFVCFFEGDYLGAALGGSREEGREHDYEILSNVVDRIVRRPPFLSLGLALSRL